MTVRAEEAFAAHRGLLVGVAYRVLGSRTDAEDVVQDAWLRWDGVDHDTVEDPRAYLVRVVTRLALDRLRRDRARREAYVGEWLPEPVLTEPAPGLDALAEQAESVSYALLVVLETLSPLERAVFVLREAFDYPYAEIAEIVDRSEPGVRQLAHRAREHVRERRRRFATDQTARRRATERFVQAATAGDVDGLLRLLAPDVELRSDGGGRAKAPLRTITGADKVARFLAAIATGPPPAPDLELRVAEVNGDPALLASSHGEPLTVFLLEPDGDRVRTVYLLANPDKLRSVKLSP